MSNNKPPKSIDDQIALLKSRGISLKGKKDYNNCKYFLSHVNYYKFSWYLKAFEQTNPSDGIFYNHSDFNFYKDIYILDQRLRVLCFEALERIEISLKTGLVNHLSYEEDEFVLYNKKVMRDLKTSRLIEGILKRHNNCSVHSSCPVCHYKKKNGDKLPIWVLFEEVSFGQASRLYSYINKAEVMNNISMRYNVKNYYLKKWYKALSGFRNTVAHNNKIFNHQFENEIKAHDKALGKLTSKKKYFFDYYKLIDYLLNQIHPNNSWKKRVDNIFIEFEKTYVVQERISSYYGFPDNYFK